MLKSSNLASPVFVTGTPRSGKSTVASILGASTEVLALDEPIWIWAGLTATRSHDRLTEHDATRRAARKAVQQCTEVLEQSGRTRYVDNYAYHALAIPLLVRLFPNSKLIYVTRDPIDTVGEMAYAWRGYYGLLRGDSGTTRTQQGPRSTVSRRSDDAIRFSKSIDQWGSLAYLLARAVKNEYYKRAHGRRAYYGPRVPGWKNLVEGQSTVEMAARQWSAMTAIGLDDLSLIADHNKFVVQYEEITSKPSMIARQLFEFADIKYPLGMEKLVSELIQPSDSLRIPSREYAGNLTLEQRQLIYDIVSGQAHQLGYARKGNRVDNG